MNRSSIWSLAAAAAILSINTAEAGTDTYRARGDLALAMFNVTQACAEDWIYVAAANHAEKVTAGAPAETPWVQVVVQRFNPCTQRFEFSYNAYQPLPAGAFSQLATNSARLALTLSLCDAFTGQCQDATVDLNWEGTGEPLRGQSMTNWTSLGFRSRYQLVGVTRPATARGTISIAGTNYIPFATTDASLDREMVGIIEVTKP